MKRGFGSITFGFDYSNQIKKNPKTRENCEKSRNEFVVRHYSKNLPAIQIKLVED